MEKIIAFTAAALLTTSSAALATGMSESSGPPLATQPEFAAAGAKSALDATKPEAAAREIASAAPAGAKGQKADAPVLLARLEEESADAPKAVETAGKDRGQPAYTAFRDVEPHEAASAAAKSAGGEAMGGPLDAAELVTTEWDSYDADGEQGLTRLEFANWAAADTGKAEFGAEAIAQRDSTAQGTATVRLLNATSVEFTYADADDDMRISLEEMNSYMQA